MPDEKPSYSKQLEEISREYESRSKRIQRRGWLATKCLNIAGSVLLAGGFASDMVNPYRESPLVEKYMSVRAEQYRIERLRGQLESHAVKNLGEIEDSLDERLGEIESDMAQIEGSYEFKAYDTWKRGITYTIMVFGAMTLLMSLAFVPVCKDLAEELNKWRKNRNLRELKERYSGDRGEK